MAIVKRKAGRYTPSPCFCPRPKKARTKARRKK